MRLSLRCQGKVGPHKLDPILRNIFLVYFCLGNTRLLLSFIIFFLSYFCVSVLFVFYYIFVPIYRRLRLFSLYIISFWFLHLHLEPLNEKGV